MHVLKQGSHEAVGKLNLGDWPFDEILRHVFAKASFPAGFAF